MTLFIKIKWVLGIVLVFLLVLTTNLVDRQNFLVVKESMEAIYADRLVAQDIIFDLSKLIWEKEAAYLKAVAENPITGSQRGIADAIVRFQQPSSPGKRKVF